MRALLLLLLFTACAAPTASRHDDLVQYQNTQMLLIKERFDRGEISAAEARAQVAEVGVIVDSELHRRAELSSMRRAAWSR